MKNMILSLTSSLLSLSLALAPAVAQEFGAKPVSATPEISLETARNRPAPTTPVVPATTTEFLAAPPLSPATAQPFEAATYETDLFTGIQDQAVLSGIVFVQLKTGVLAAKKVAYYLDGTKSGKEYGAPFTWGGPAGFDTRTLTDGTYTLSGAITTRDGEIDFAYTFTVNNSGIVPDPGCPGTACQYDSLERLVRIEQSDGSFVLLDYWDIGPEYENIIKTKTYYAAGGALQRTESWYASECYESEIFADGSGTDYFEENFYIENGRGRLRTTYHADGTSTTVDQYWPDTDTVQHETDHAADGTITETREYDATGKLIKRNGIPVEEPLVSEDGYFQGVRSGATLGGTIAIQIHSDAGLAVQKISYYLNGTKAGKAYTPPFAFGTARLANGTYTLSGTISLYRQGAIPFSYTFTVRNPEPTGDDSVSDSKNKKKHSEQKLLSA